MEQTVLTREFSPIFSVPTLSLLILLFPFIFIIRKHISDPSPKSKPLPPGPRPLPIIGNLLNLGKNPLHISLANLAKSHGPLISLRLGAQLLVVGSSSKAAEEILRTHDRLLSARYLPKTFPYDSHVLDLIAIIWATKCKYEWKALRALCRTELFSAKAIGSQAILREKKVGEMVEFLRGREGKVVNVGEIVFTTVFNTLANLIFSKDVVSLENEKEGSELKNLMWKMFVIASTPNMADLYPIFSRMDPQGLRRNATKCVREMFSKWGIYIEERRKNHVLDGPQHDFLDVFLANGFGDDQINWLVFELFTAGIDTTTTIIEWKVAELVKNKESIKKLREELERDIGKRKLNENHVSQLPYLNACVKEALRLHPATPCLFHHAPEPCEVMGYTIPKESQVIVNVWAIGRNPSVWEDPLSFKPERFLDSDLDVKGQHFELLPFGSGRRSCPGMQMAMKEVTLILTSLVHQFDWSLANGEDPALNLDMSEKFAITVQKEQPLLLVPKQIT